MPASWVALGVVNGEDGDHALTLQYGVINAVRKHIDDSFAVQGGDCGVLKRVLLNSGEFEFHGVMEPLAEMFLDYFVIFGRFDEFGFRFRLDCKVERSCRILRILA